MFECFIEKRYEKYHDHWLSYCTNELTKICPEDKYFIFGLNNYLKHFIFIKNRKTTYATLLEMLMAAYKMVNRLKEQGRIALFEQAYMPELQKLIEFRADFQTTGFFIRKWRCIWLGQIKFYMRFIFVMIVFEYGLMTKNTIYRVTSLTLKITKVMSHEISAC